MASAEEAPLAEPSSPLLSIHAHTVAQIYSHIAHYLSFENNISSPNLLAMANPVSLPTSLTPQEAIVDAVHRALLGIDTHDRAMWDSAWVQREEASFDLNGTIFAPKSALDARVFDIIGPLDSHHYLSNVRFTSIGEREASLTTYIFAQHKKPGEGMHPDKRGLLVGANYFVDLVREDEVWKVKKWGVRMVWREGDKSVIPEPSSSSLR